MPPPPVRSLHPTVRPYAWGSRRFLADLQGRPSPSATPEAEAWFGAHPQGPSRVDGAEDPAGLDAVIAADPVGELGTDVVARFGPQLPFLVKLLAADGPLSLQAHPSAAQARRGFEVEEALGLPRDAPDRLYRDAWPKPELMHALTPFRALCGFREPAATARLIGALEVPSLRRVADDLAQHGDRALQRTMAWALRDGREEAVAALPELRVGAGRLRDRLVRSAQEESADGGSPTAGWEAATRSLIDLVDLYPSDPGVVVALLLSVVELAPGETIHLPAGNLHAYLGGAGVEVMASSDNVVRGGLTPKHVDVDALLEVVDPRSLPLPLVPGQELAGETVHRTPTPHFRFSHLPLGTTPVQLPRRGPELLVAVGGRATVTADGHPAEIRSGYGAFVSSRARHVMVTGNARLYRTTVGDPAAS